MFRKSVLLMMGIGMTLSAVAWVYAADEAKPTEQPKAGGRARGGGMMGGAARGTGWQMAVMTYTFNKFTLFEAIDKAKKAGADAIETYAWQKISDKHGNMVLNQEMTDSAIKELEDKLTESKIRMVGYYSNTLGKDAKADRAMFEFLKKLKVRYIVAEPEEKALESVDKLAQEFKIRVAIHNHPKDASKPEYKNWNPDAVMKMLEGHSQMIGCCADNGHWARSGLDGVEAIKKYKGRLISMHLKDVNEVGPKAHDVPYGKGVIKLMDVLKAVKEQGGFCTFSIEYEANLDNNVKDVAECIAWFNKAKAELGVKDRPAGNRAGRTRRQ
jgi:sugar phosphate isomerase/epimerase